MVVNSKRRALRERAAGVASGLGMAWQGGRQSLIGMARSVNPARLPQMRRWPAHATSPVLAVKCIAAIAGLGLAIHVAELSGDRAASSVVDLMTTATVPAGPLRDVRRIDISAWQPIARPSAYLAVTSAELDGLAVSHEARRNMAGVREDLIAHGSFEADLPYLQLVLRLGPGEELARAFIIDTMRRAAQVGLSVDRIDQPHAMPTKLGPMDVTDIVLSAGGQQRGCLAFRVAMPDQPLTMQGWWCGTAQRPADRQQLSCLIDRTGVTQASEAGELRSVFAGAELRRDARCNPPKLVAAGRKTSWLDADAAAIPLRSVTKPGGASQKPAPKKPANRT